MKTNKIFTAFLILVFLINIQTSSQTRVSKTKMLKVSDNNFLNSEHIFIHTDRDMYIAGETLFFKTELILSDTTLVRSNLCYIVLRDTKSTITKLLVKLDSGNSFGSFYLTDTLKTGIYELVGFTNYMRNFGESTYFRKNILIVNRFDKTLAHLIEMQPMESSLAKSDSIKESSINHGSIPFKIITEKDSFGVREKIKIGIGYTDLFNQPVVGNISISVKETNPFALFQIQKKWTLDSSKQFANPGIETNKITYLPEQKDMFIKGCFRKKDASPLPNECLYLSTPDTIANLLYSITDSVGNFTFSLNQYYIGKQLIIKPRENTPEVSNGKIELEDQFDLKEPFHPDFPEMTAEMRRFILSSQNLVQIQKMYNIKTAKDPDPVTKNLNVPVPYNHPTSICYPSEFVALKNLDEICANILTGVKLKKDKTRYDLYVYNYLTDQFFDSPTIVFVDGVPIDNVNQLLSLGSPDIYKVEVCKIPRVKGTIEFPGIVSVITTKKKFNSLAFSSSMLRYSTENFTPKTDFNSPVYSKKSASNPTPDFRQLLYWNPSVELKTNGITYIEFNASDWFSDYLIEVSGISKEGKPLIAYRKIKIYR